MHRDTTRKTCVFLRVCYYSIFLCTFVPERALIVRFCVIEVQLPISKSIANRLLILHAVQGRDGVLTCDETDLCDDVRLLRDALVELRTAHAEPHTIDLHNCGTAMRFLTAYCAVQNGIEVILTGAARMQERPIGQLVDALREAGADIEYLGNEGFPPLRIHGKALSRSPITLNDSLSSQFVSALMLVGFPVETNDDSPYINMTQELITQVQKGESIRLERDWSAASYWYEYVALYGGEITLPNLYFQTLQGDSAVAEIFESLGVKTEETDAGIRLSRELISSAQHSTIELPLHIDFSAYPDLYPAVYVTCHTLGITLKARGTERLPHKESNRLKAFEQLEPRAKNQEPRIMSSYADHRIAMALLVAGYQVDDMECISKSYPQFVSQLRNVTFVVPFKKGRRTKDEGRRTKDHILYISDEGKGKKWALRTGIEQATTEYVWLTDADVERTYYPIFVPPTRLGDLTILPLRMDEGQRTKDKGRRTASIISLQSVEYLAIQSLTMWAAEQQHAVMCSGANLIVKREEWLRSYNDLHTEIPSGDDMFLLESFKRRGLHVKALYLPEYIATIQPIDTWKALFRQRMRWAGKAPKYTDCDILFCGTLTLLANLFVVICPPFLLIKYLLDMHLIHKAKRYHLTANDISLSTALWALLVAVLYPWYILICLIGGIIRQHKW